MRNAELGLLEERVLQATIVLNTRAYGAEIKKELEEQMRKTLSVGAIHATLKRMEMKGFLNSRFGEATEKRRGNRKRIYQATPYAYKVLNETKDIHSDSEKPSSNTMQYVLTWC